MLYHDVTYETFSENPETKTKRLWFHISEPEMIRLEAEKQEVGGLAGWIESVQKMTDNNEIVAFFEDIVLRSYGEREDEEHFAKSPEIYAQFKKSAAYSALIGDMLFYGDQLLSKFVNEIFPKKMVEVAKKKAAELQAAEAAKPTTPDTA